jgi:hypothetical protein
VGRSYFLADLTEEGEHASYRVAKESAAGVVGGLSVSSLTENDEFNLVFVRNLKTGKLLAELQTSGQSANSKEPSAGPADSLVVTPSGTAAWISTAGAGVYQVHVTEAGHSRTLASAAGIGPTSLALAGNTLYWTENGHAASGAIN